MRCLAPILAFVPALAICGLSGSAVLAQQAEAVELPGRCNYSDRLAPLIDQAHVFVECDRLEMRRSDGGVDLTFSFPARLREIRFRGSFAETGRYTVSAIWLRSQRDWEEAEGDCEFDPAGSDAPAVVCVVKKGARIFVVNFAPEA